jgi:hypothetical protein
VGQRRDQAHQPERAWYPRNAVRSFYSSGIDALFAGNFLSEKWSWAGLQLQTKAGRIKNRPQDEILPHIV